MKKFVARAACATAAIALAGCATAPQKISAAHVSPIKYQSYDCEQIGLEQATVEERTSNLYHSLKKRNNSDKWVMGGGLLLFWPALFFLKGDNDAENAEYAQLKGEYEALRSVSVQRKCQLVFSENLADTIEGKKSAKAEISGRATG